MITNNVFSIIDSQLSCADAQSDEGLREYVGSGTIENLMVCDKDKDRAYFLAASPDPGNKCEPSYQPQNPGRKCSKFSGPPGALELVPGNNWGGVTREDIVFG